MTETVNRTDDPSGDVFLLWEDNSTQLFQPVKIITSADGAAAVGWDGFALADNLSRTMTVPGVGAAVLLDDGSNLFRARGNTSGLYVQGPVAADATIGGNPVVIGGRSHDGQPTAVSADGEAVWAWYKRSGAKVVIAKQDKVRIQVTPTIDTAAYVAGDRLGSVMTLASASLGNAGYGMLDEAILVDDANSAFDIDLALFLNSPTLANADNGAYQITDANLATAIPAGFINFATANSVSNVDNRTITGTYLGGKPALSYQTDSDDTALYGVFIARGAYDAVATDDLVLQLTFVRD